MPQSLKVIIPNIQKVIGKISIGLFNIKANHLKEGKAIKQSKIPVQQDLNSFVFKDIPAGDYSVAIFHDQNDDGVCNTNSLGIPTENFGFSNNVKPIFKAPSFEQTKIKINKNKDTSITVRLIH